MSECFSVLADETTDISTTEQLSICVRYVDSKNILNESFLQFFSIHSLTGKDLATSILRGKIFYNKLFNFSFNLTIFV